jgi:hypothetical protein
MPAIEPDQQGNDQQIVDQAETAPQEVENQVARKDEIEDGDRD